MGSSMLTSAPSVERGVKVLDDLFEIAVLDRLAVDGECHHTAIHLIDLGMCQLEAERLTAALHRMAARMAATFTCASV